MERNVSHRIEYLDSLRGIAAMAVVLSHYFPSYGTPYILPSWTAQTPISAIQDGLAAVTLFFVLSGLVLSIKHFRPDSPPYSLANSLPLFYVARLARIYLPFLASLSIAALLKAYCHSPQNTVPEASGWNLLFWAQPESVGSFVRQAFLFIPSVAVNSRLIPMDWTLTTELNFSLWFPFLTLIAVSGVGNLLVFSVLSIALMGVDGSLFHFTLGILIARYFKDIQRYMFDRRVSFKVGLFTVGMFLYSCREVRNLLPALSLPLLPVTWIWYVTGIGAGLILISAIGSARLQKILSHNALTYLGKISYSIYLLHFPIIKAFTPHLLAFLNSLGVTDPVTANRIGWLGTMAFIILASSVSYRVIELPSIRLGRRIAGLAKDRFPSLALA